MRSLLLVLLLVATGACADLSEGSAPSAPELTPPSAEFRDAPTEVELGGVTWRIDARAWRNVQPHAGGGGVPRCANLCAKVLVTSVDGAPSTTVTAEEAWALRDDGLAPFEGIDPVEVEDGLEVTCERGPRSDPGTRLAVIVRLATDAGSSVLVRSPEIEVGPDA